jgi:hypothetical protein
MKDIIATRETIERETLKIANISDGVLMQPPQFLKELYYDNILEHNVSVMLLKETFEYYLLSGQFSPIVVLQNFHMRD